MATRGQELNTRITATDEASTIVDQVSKKLAGLEDDEHEVPVTAKDDATKTIVDVEARLDRLTKEDRKVVLEASARQLEREVDRAVRKLAQVATLTDQEFELVVQAKDQASAKLAKVEAQIDELDRKPPAEVEVNANTKGFLDDIGGLNAQLDGVIGKVADLAGRGGGAAATGGILAVGAGLLTAVDHASELAIEVDNLRTLTGDTAEEASRLSGVWKQAGFDGKDLQDVVLQMNGVLQTSPELVERLGINLNDGKSIGERFVQVVGLLGSEFQNSAERSQAASQLFGEEGVRQVNAVTNAFGDLNEAVEDYNGKIWTEEQIDRARAHEARVRSAKAEWEALWLSASDAGFGIIDAGERFFGAYKNMGEDFRALFDGGAARDNNQRTKAWEDATKAVDNFDKSLLENITTAQDARAVAARYTDDLTAQNIIVAQWAETHRGATEAVQVSAETLALQAQYAEVAEAKIQALADADKRAAKAAEDAAEAHDLKVRAMEAELDAAENLYEQTLLNIGGEDAVRRSKIDTEDAIASLNETVADSESTLRDLELAQLDVRDAAIKQADAAVRYAEDQAKANGKTLDAKDKAAIYRTELQSVADQLEGPMRDAILGFIADLDSIPTKKTVQISLAGGGAVTVDPDGRKRGQRHVGGLFAAGDRITVLPGEEIEMSMRGPGRVYSQEDVARERQQQMAPGRRSRGGRAVSFAGATFIGTPDPRYLQQWARQMERELRGRR